MARLGLRPSYRARQFWRALFATPAPADWALAENVLSPALLALFRRMQPSEQAHSLSIARQLLERGETSPELLAAALLHDVGKSCQPLRLWERVWVVVAKTLFPTQAKAWGQAEPHGWRRALVVAEQHPRWGAELAAQAGAPPLVVAIIRRHQDQEKSSCADCVSANPKLLEDCYLSRLQELDDQN